MSKIRKILRVGFINTLRINLHYFGMGGGVTPNNSLWQAC